MKLLVDSSFFFPLIGVAIAHCPKDAIIELLNKVEVIHSDLLLFELSAKGCKLVTQEIISIEDLTRGITAIKYHPRIRSIPIHYSEIQSLACDLRKHHSDFIDCLLVATAVYHADGMISLDKSLQKKAQKEWKPTLEKVNPKFKVLLWKDYQKED